MIRKSDEPQKPGGALFRSGFELGLESHRIRNIAQRRHVAEKRIVLKNNAHSARVGRGVRYIAASEIYFSLVWRYKTYEKLEQRGLAAAGGTEYRKKFPVLDRKRNMIERQLALIVFCKSFCSQYFHASSRSSLTFVSSTPVISA